MLKEFLTTKQLFSIRRNGKREKVCLSEDDIGIAVHDSKGLSGERNLHAHVVFAPKVRKGDKEYSLNLTKSELKGLYREWERFLKEKGYSLRRSPVRGEPHFGPQRLRFDTKARASFRHLSTAKRLWREAVEEEQIARTLERAVQVQGGEGLLSWDEIAQEEERKGVATRGREKSGSGVSVQSPPPRPSRPVKPVQQPKPVTKPKPVQQPRQPVQPRVSLLQRPSQRVEETEVASKDPVRRIKQEVERELAAKKKREQEIARQIDYETKKQARTLANSPPPRHGESYSEKRTQRMEVGNVNGNPFITQEVEEVREEQEIQVQRKLLIAEMKLVYRYRKTIKIGELKREQEFKNSVNIRFRVPSDWSTAKKKNLFSLVASVAAARLFGFPVPEEVFQRFDDFTNQELRRVDLAVQEYMEKKGWRPLFSDRNEALRALSVKRCVIVIVNIIEDGKIVEQHTFALVRESFTSFERYAEEVRRRRPQPPGQGQGQGQPPQQPPEPLQEEPDEEDWPEPGM